MSATIKRNGQKNSGNGINLRTVLSLVAVNGIQPTTIVQLVGTTGKPHAVCGIIAAAVADGGMTVDQALTELGQATQQQTPPAVAAPKKTAAELYADFKAGKITEDDMTAALARLTVKEPSTVKPLFTLTMPGDKVMRCVRDEAGNLIKSTTGRGNQKAEQVFEGKARIEFRAGVPVAAWTAYVMRRHMEKIISDLESRGYTEAEARKDSTCAANWDA